MRQPISAFVCSTPCVMIWVGVRASCHARDYSQGLMKGRLNEHPLAELIREIHAAQVSGVVRLSREPAQAAVYFEKGSLVFATSNLRTHRLREVLTRGFHADLTHCPPSAADTEVAEFVLNNGQLSTESLTAARGLQVSEVLRVALLWVDGNWNYDQRVRLADAVRVNVDVPRLLLECARRLPSQFVAERLNVSNGEQFIAANEVASESLLPAEAFLLSRATSPLSLTELLALSGVSEESGLRTIYALALSGYLQRSEWPLAFASKPSSSAPKPPVPPAGAGVSAKDDSVEVQDLFKRLDAARDYYDVLSIGRSSELDEIKRAYHDLARRFHPDRFHKREPELRSRIDSAFAQIAQAYEVLSNQSSRGAYDAKLSGGPSRGPQSTAPEQGQKSNGKESAKKTRAEGAFQRGMSALKENRREDAIRLLAEAAMLNPNEPRYRANYGYAMIRQPSMQRIAETEMKAALSIEPNNPLYRVMLAELYKELGLKRRAESELEKVLRANPKHAAAQAVLNSLRKG